MTQAMEDYLRAILSISRKKVIVRAVDIARVLGYSKPSVHRAVKILEENGLITVSEENHIRLTETGQKTAEELTERYDYFADMLREAGIDEETADREAHMMEHTLSDESFRALKRHRDELQNL